MFHTILTLSYLIPNIYLFFRIWQLFIRKEHRIYYVVVYILLFLIYPAGNFLEGKFSLAAKILSDTSNYLLPFFLYLFLCVLLIDLFLILNLLFRVVPREKFRSKAFMNRGLVAVILCSIAVVTAGIINFNTIRTTGYQITVPRKSSELKELKIAFVSDFHLHPGINPRFIERFVNKITEAGPDLMLYGGDIVEGRGNDREIEHFEELLGRITARYGSLAVPGNHDHYAGSDINNFFSRAGIVLLTDSAAVIDNSFVIAGRNDSRERNRKSAEQITSGLPDSLPIIMLDHRPSETEQISRTRTDVAFSGHTHHGQLFPINLITRKVYELSYGYMKKGNTHFFVSSGIRLWGPPVRTVGKSEIIIVNCRFQ